MIDVTPFAEASGGKPVAVFGLGVSGQATIKALKAVNVKVIAWDDSTGNPPENLADCAALILSPVCRSIIQSRMM